MSRLPDRGGLAKVRREELVDERNGVLGRVIHHPGQHVRLELGHVAARAAVRTLLEDAWRPKVEASQKAENVSLFFLVFFLVGWGSPIVRIRALPVAAALAPPPPPPPFFFWSFPKGGVYWSGKSHGRNPQKADSTRKASGGVMH